jgi:hypothetical protein
MNEHIRARVARGKLVDIKRAGSERIDIPATLHQLKQKTKRRRDKWCRND